MKLYSSVQSSSQNENIGNTSKKLLKTKYWTFEKFEENPKLFWRLYLGRGSVVHPPSKGERLSDIQHNMSMVIDTRFHIWFTMTVYYKIQQLFYYKMRHNFIAKWVRFFITKCDSFIIKCDDFITKCGS